jgi:hypothetical protein
MSWQTDYAWKSVMVGFGALFVFALTAGRHDVPAGASFALALICITLVPLLLDIHEEYA